MTISTPATGADPALLSIYEMILLSKLRLLLQVSLSRWALKWFHRLSRLTRWPRVLDAIPTVATIALLVLLWFNVWAWLELLGLCFLAFTVWVVVVFAVAPNMSAEIKVTQCPTCGDVTGESTKPGLTTESSPAT
jgi:hypothetical protein